MSNKQIRQAVRILHIIGGSMITAYIYSYALSSSDIYRLVMQIIVTPALIISGIVLWQQPRILKLFKKSSERS
ncbi:MAG: hypothetical protein MUE54_05360 [Anaerolineae bacterium]|nr:hypothetical protein [Anaerolineae bacterium]